MKEKQCLFDRQYIYFSLQVVVRFNSLPLYIDISRGAEALKLYDTSIWVKLYKSVLNMKKHIEKIISTNESKNYIFYQALFENSWASFCFSVITLFL